MTFYVQKIDVLQQRNISFLQQFLFNKNFKRKVFFKQIIIENSIIKKFELYRQLQKTFVQTSFLIHFVIIR